MAKINTVIFDMDGTVLSTGEDLAASVNYALEKFGYPKRTLEEVLSFVGNGVAVLIDLALPEGKNNPQFDEVLQTFKTHYAANCAVQTKPYDGILEMLAKFKEKGYKLAIVTNKFYKAAQELNDQYFKDLIPVAIGEQEGVRKKPAPDTVLLAIEKLDSTLEESIYVGDSEVDIETAQNAGMDCILCTWGFRRREDLMKYNPKYVADKPMDIFTIVDGL